MRSSSATWPLFRQTARAAGGRRRCPLPDPWSPWLLASNGPLAGTRGAVVPAAWNPLGATTRESDRDLQATDPGRADVRRQAIALGMQTLGSPCPAFAQECSQPSRLMPSPVLTRYNHVSTIRPLESVWKSVESCQRPIGRGSSANPSTGESRPAGPFSKGLDGFSTIPYSLRLREVSEQTKCWC